MSTREENIKIVVSFYQRQVAGGIAMISSLHRADKAREVEVSMAAAVGRLLASASDQYLEAMARLYGPELLEEACRLQEQVTKEVMEVISKF